MGRHVLVVEDDPAIADLLCVYFAKEEGEVRVVSNGEDALSAFDASVTLVILDLNLPGRLDGLEVARAIRHRSTVPIIVLSARDNELDRVTGLELGADDYVTKPFSPRELLARVRAIERRVEANPSSAAALSFNGVDWDPRARQVLRDGVPVALTNREFDLLGYFFAHPATALTRRELLDGVWGPEWYGDDRTVDVHVLQLRKKLGGAIAISTVWGVGYRFDPEEH
ncbi:two component transcriptional regulator, winged helix family [Acidimicrobium ferrooxidans DSM 10331]|uniref:Two component transcriptional regulator, winged helix family n=1 Tax=Acidimicrobium ferrooxidans (strain DSM 10331 / JCM 15462 / NBRC 103882 / ICP) TaxID=525909 RepID=C7LZ74_ACIFD|nr:response regulator transcription factor [Acidimicrobium ferrooxidans]ACU54032.1 two component transcriptional regulator, winged helix family [Acidimicrobium ferrooxidans DSM 10331]